MLLAAISWTSYGEADDVTRPTTSTTALAKFDANLPKNVMVVDGISVQSCLLGTLGSFAYVYLWKYSQIKESYKYE